MRNNSDTNRKEIESVIKPTTEGAAYSAADNQKMGESDKIESKKPSDVIEAFLTYLFL